MLIQFSSASHRLSIILIFDWLFCLYHNEILIYSVEKMLKIELPFDTRTGTNTSVLQWQIISFIFSISKRLQAHTLQLGKHFCQGQLLQEAVGSCGKSLVIRENALQILNFCETLIYDYVVNYFLNVIKILINHQIHQMMSKICLI